MTMEFRIHETNQSRSLMYGSYQFCAVMEYLSTRGRIRPP